MHVYISLLEVQSKWDQIVRGGLSVLSIGTAPPRARRTEGMRYIVKPKNEISAGKWKQRSRPCRGASSHPLRTEERFQTLETSAGQISRQKKIGGLLFDPNPWTTVPASTQILQAVSKPIRAMYSTRTSGYYLNQHQECKK